jgi:hypothetical protein
MWNFWGASSGYQKHKEKRKERNNKGKSKGTVQNHKKNSKRRKVKEGNQKLVCPSFLIQHRKFLESKTILSCAPSFPARDLVPPLHLCTPTFHAPLAFFCSVSLGSSSILYVFATLIQFYIC